MVHITLIGSIVVREYDPNFGVHLVLKEVIFHPVIRMPAGLANCANLWHGPAGGRLV